MTRYDSDVKWADVRIDGDPQLILGRRQGARGIEAVVVEVHPSLSPDLRSICERFKRSLEETSPRPYEPHAAVDRDNEHFVLELGDLPEQPEPARSRRTSASDGENPDRTAALVRALRSPTSLATISAKELREFSALFYSIAFQQEAGDWVNFIRKVNPRAILKPGWMWTQYGTALRKAETPDLVIESQIDVLLGTERLASFNGNVIKDLFTDVHLAARDSDKYVDGVISALGTEMAITEESERILRDVARRKFSIARKLYHLRDTLGTLDIKPDRVREVLSRHNFDHSIFLNENDQFSFSAENVGQFIDLLEGRFYESDWNSEPRRADRYSTRP